jgi:NAD(P) transhydrogenase subunit beta
MDLRQPGQHAVRELADVLEKRGVTVKYGIHPVADMPGHMNVLLAEAGSLPSLYELEQINPDFPPPTFRLLSAQMMWSIPTHAKIKQLIAGMPILDVDRSKSVIVLKRGQGKGFSGLENPLFFKPVTGMLYGDAKDTLTKLQAVQHARN